MSPTLKFPLFTKVLCPPPLNSFHSIVPFSLLLKKLIFQNFPLLTVSQISMMEMSLSQKGAVEPEVSTEKTLDSMRYVSPLEATLSLIASAPLERSKRQSRRSLLLFQEFLESLSSEEMSLPFPVLVCLWLQSYLASHPKVRRVSTLLQKARELQAALPLVPFLHSTWMNAYAKGLGRIQPISSKELRAASADQVSNLELLAKDSWSKAAIWLLTRGAARWSDIRNWIGKKGILVCHPTLSAFSLRLNVRKTDQAGASSMKHVIGPIVLRTEEMKDLMKTNSIWTVDPLKESPFSPNSFMKHLQNLKMKSGIQNMIELRRRRARVAAQRLPVTQVAELLGHRPGSTSTKRYIQDLDIVEKMNRLIMTAK